MDPEDQQRQEPPRLPGGGVLLAKTVGFFFGGGSSVRYRLDSARWCFFFAQIRGCGVLEEIGSFGVVCNKQTHKSLLFFFDIARFPDLQPCCKP